MAGKKENIKSLFTNTRTRVIIVFTGVLLLIAVVVGIIKFRSVTNNTAATATVSYAPGSIQSIPGAPNPTAQYAKLQQEQNLNQAEKYFKKAISLGLSMDQDLALAKLNLAGIALSRRRKLEATNLLNEAKKLDKHNMLKDQIKMMKDQLKKI